MGWILAPNGFGFKKCVVWGFRVRGDTHSLFEYWARKLLRNLRFL